MHRFHFILVAGLVLVHCAHVHAEEALPVVAQNQAVNPARPRYPGPNAGRRQFAANRQMQGFPPWFVEGILGKQKPAGGCQAGAAEPRPRPAPAPRRPTRGPQMQGFPKWFAEGVLGNSKPTAGGGCQGR